MKSRLDWGLLLVRLGLGVTFLVHGVGKFMDLGGTGEFFASIGIPAPSLAATVVAIVETFSGLLIILGLWTTIAGSLLAVVMIVAIVTVKFEMGFLGGYELDYTLLAIALGIAAAGPGRFAIRRRTARVDSMTSEVMQAAPPKM